MTAKRVQAIAGAGASDPMLRQMLDALPVAVYMTDAEGRLTYCNAAAIRLTGRVPELGTDQWCVTWKTFQLDGTPVPHDRCPMALSLRGADYEAGTDYVGERQDGSRFCFAPYPAIVRDAEGRIAGGINVLIDTTARRAERKERERDAMLLGAIIESSDDAIISKDLNGIITSWNNGAERLFGYTAAEAVGNPITILIPPDRLDEEPEILARLRRGERVDHFETIRRRKDGTLLNISLTISPVKNASGKVVGASKIARDITESKRIQSALAESERRFRQLADSMPQIVWTARADGYLDYFNERWYDFSGFPRDSFGYASWVAILHPEDVQRYNEVWSESVLSGKPFQIEIRMWDRGEQRWRWFMGRALPIKDAGGRVSKWFGTATDIDSQKRTEEDLRRANEDLERFAFSASHDLQEPLRTVSIYSELIAHRYAAKLDGQALEFLGYLTGAANRLQMLVRDLLAYTRVTKFEPPAEAANANEALKATLANLAGVAAETGARIDAGPLPVVCVHSAHLQQLFQNLIGNAIKYRSPDRAPVIHVSAERLGGDWTFSVTDNGIGIEPEYQKAIFGLFKRLHAGDSGTGIGLAICQRIVDRYHGRIWVESEPGRGSRFRFTIPAEISQRT
jgi:PAS domain S-box-containing protein